MLDSEAFLKAASLAAHGRASNSFVQSNSLCITSAGFLHGNVATSLALTQALLHLVQDAHTGGSRHPRAFYKAKSLQAFLPEYHAFCKAGDLLQGQCRRAPESEIMSSLSTKRVCRGRSSARRRFLQRRRVPRLSPKRGNVVAFYKASMCRRSGISSAGRRFLQSEWVSSLSTNQVSV